MRSAFQNEELNEQHQAFGPSGIPPEPDPESRPESSPDAASPDREVTIGATTLLVIFFGLVLLCGLFFGLGYTFGRRSPADASVVAQAQPASQSFGAQPKPSAFAPPTSQPASPPVGPVTDLSQPTPAETASPPPTESAIAAATQQPSTTTRQAVPAKQTAAAAEQVTAPSEAQAASQTGPQVGTMVQVAAVSNPADADVLVRALQQHGFSASARRFPPDLLIHVQIGPFSNRPDAVAMKQKLLNDGYNAILK